MAGSPNFKDEVAKRLECNICMDRLRNPKDLRCHHTFCKDCLEGVLKFRKDGSAVIRCPLRCSEHTIIPVDKTVNDLGTPFHLKDILEMFDAQSVSSVPDKKALCQLNEDCAHAVTVYCSACSLMLCQNCSSSHDAEHDSNTNVPVRFHEKEGKVKIICTEHSTFAKYFCCEYEFICCYCKHRNHRGHNPLNIEFRYKHIKELLTTRLNSMSRINNNVQKSLIATESCIADCRKRLETSLTTRKLLCLSQYISFLSKSEQKIMKEYDSLTSRQIKHYSAPNSEEYYSSLNKCDGIKVLVDGESIVDSILQSHAANMDIPSLSIKLKNAEYSERKSLGVLAVEKMDNFPLSEGEVSSSFFYDIPQLDMSQKNISRLMEDLEELLREARQRSADHRETNLSDDVLGKSRLKTVGCDASAADKASSSANITKEEKKLQRLASKEVVKQFKKQGINYVYELIKENDEESMSLLLSAKNHISKMRGPFGSTPLLTAARYNRVEMMKMLMDHGSSLDDKGTNESTVLHISAFHGAYEALAWLLPKCHHMIDHINSSDNRTPIQYATSNGHLRCMKLLLKRGADICIKDKDGCTALDIAKEKSSEASVDLLKLTLAQRSETDNGKYSGCSTVDEYKKKFKLV